MNSPPGADAAKRPQGKNRAHQRRGLRRLLYYVSSIVAGIICGFLLGNGWSRPPIIPSHRATGPAASAAMPLTPPQAPALDLDKASKAEALPVAKVSQPTVVAPRPLPLRPHLSGKLDKAQAVLPTRKPATTIPPPAMPQPQPQPPSDSTYIVQVAAFSKKANAAQAVDQYKAEGFEAGMVKIGGDGSRVLYRVYVARFSDIDRAKAAAKAFRVNKRQYAYAVRYQPAPPAAHPGQR